MGRVTIYQIARIAGVSSATVSRAFTRPELVNDTVRQRILAVAAQMDYRPNLVARGLATGRTSTLGLVVPDITNPFMPPLIRAIQRAAAAVECSVLLVDSQEDASAELQLISRLHGQVDGLILAPPRAPAAALHDALLDLPCVVVNRIMRNLPAVVCDNTDALVEAGRHLSELGHRKVALLGGPPAAWASQRRAAAVRTWAAQAGVELAELGPFEASFDGGRQAGAAFLEEEATAAFAFDDVMASGVMAELTECGVIVPHHRSVVGCDDVLFARMMMPSLTTVTAPVDKIGQAAVDTLHGRMRDGSITSTITRFDGTYRARDSIAPAPGYSSERRHPDQPTSDPCVN